MPRAQANGIGIAYEEKGTGARQVVLPAVGHTPLLENAELFNRKLEEFLGQT